MSFSGCSVLHGVNPNLKKKKKKKKNKKKKKKKKKKKNGKVKRVLVGYSKSIGFILIQLS